jgi:hypothetical protein
MRFFTREGPVDYPSYQFSYTLWADLEGDCPSQLYRLGYLPYSGEQRDSSCLFYRARSLRLILAALAVDKKRRYDHRQWQELGLLRQEWKAATFRERQLPEAEAHALRWTAQRFQPTWLSPERLRYILEQPYLNRVLTWSDKAGPVAYALVVNHGKMAHYWFAFYDPKAVPMAHGFLLDFLSWCRDNSITHAYLGTAYGLKSRYKSRGLSGIEFFDGDRWCPDKARLQVLQEADPS